MSPSARRSVRKKAVVSGTGLHTGARTEATFLPAPAGQGIVFCRVDLAGKPQIPARLSEVEAVERRTAIGKGESTIHTVEHLLAAVAAHEIDDLTVELRWPDGFGRHKAADILGGLALTGGRVRAHIVATRPSHGGNIALARALTRAAQRGGAPKMDIGRIMDVLPHRYPFLLVDRIIEVEGQQRIVGIKNVTINEPFFQGHFPGHPIMPGVLIIEAMAQVGGMLLMGFFEGQNVEDKVVYFMSLDNVKFRRPVVPGDQIRFELEMVQFRGKTCKMKGVGFVDGQVVAEADMMASVVDR